MTNTDNNIDRELAETELEHVSASKGQYMEFKLKEVLISGVIHNGG